MKNPMTQSGFLYILAAVTAYGIFHSLTASLGVKKFFKDWLGSKVDRYYRLVFNMVSVITLVPVLGLAAFLPNQPLYAITLPFRVVTSGLQAAALLGLLWGVRQTDALDFAGVRQLLHFASPEKRGKLVVSGLYRYMRHPLYFFGLVFLWLSPVMSWNLLALNIGFSAYLLGGIVLEERKLLIEFGEDYAEYRRRTPMLIPRVRARL